jgi:hypothetical protein
MKRYEVKVMLDFETTVIVEANDVYEANEIAKEEVGSSFTVYNSDLEDYYSWDYITAYDPEEIAE